MKKKGKAGSQQLIMYATCVVCGVWLCLVPIYLHHHHREHKFRKSFLTVETYNLFIFL